MSFLRPKLSVCIIGAGNGGVAMAGHLGLKGHRVRLYSRDESKVAPVRRAGGITVTGAVQGFGPVELATTNLAEAIDGADVIMVTTPASAHVSVARDLAPHLDRQIIVLNPGRTGGALEVHHVLRKARRYNTVAEAQSFIYASRAEGPDRAHIFDIKREVPVAAMPARRTPIVLRTLRRLYPEFVAARNVLETSFANIGAIFHPAPLILNASKVDSGVPFDYYHEGITPSIASLMERIDAERLAVAAALGVITPSAKDWLEAAYGARGETLYEAIQNNESYRGIKAPQTLRHRYIYEDVPTGLIPIASFGRHLGLPTPFTESLIQMACGVTATNYWLSGRTVQSLGLADMSPADIRHYVETGFKRPASAPAGAAIPAFAHAQM